MVKNWAFAKPKLAQSPKITISSQNSWLRRNLPNDAMADSGIDGLPKRVF
jgi:hypothetical protein